MSANAYASDAATELQRPYDGGQKAFHWLVVALVAMQLILALIIPSFVDKDAKEALFQWHFAVGSTILLVMVLRLAWRLTHTQPPPPSDLSPTLKLVSRATHWAFYAILVGLPIGGWVAANAFGSTVRLLGLIPLPSLSAPDKAFAESIGGVHVTVAWVLIALLALHISGALYHALVKKDGVIRRIMPGAVAPQV